MNDYVVVNGQEYKQITKIKNLRLCNVYEPFKYYIQEMIIDEEENYRLKGKNQSGNNAIMPTINKKSNQKNNKVKYGK